MSRPHDPAIPNRKPPGRARRTSGCRISIADTIPGIHLRRAAGFLARVLTATE